MLMLPGNFSGDGKQGVSYWIPSPEKIRTMVAQHFDQGVVEVEDLGNTNLRIAIQNGTRDKQAARLMVAHLQKLGYSNIYIGEDWHEPLKVTRILAQNGDDFSAAQLRSALEVGEVLVESTGNLGSDITLQIGEDWQRKENGEKY
jgi:hypothetical protein